MFFSVFFGETMKAIFTMFPIECVNGSIFDLRLFTKSNNWPDDTSDWYSLPYLLNLGCRILAMKSCITEHHTAQWKPFSDSPWEHREHCDVHLSCLCYWLECKYGSDEEVLFCFYQQSASEAKRMLGTEMTIRHSPSINVSFSLSRHFCNAQDRPD